tara:strand:- start:767 stop:2035 length:1269 start_codon:yes stop_codon:yes gene_type:complete
MAKKETVKKTEKKSVKEPKLKARLPKQLVTKEVDNIVKLDLTKAKKDAVQEQSTNEIPVGDKPTTSEKVLEKDVKKTDEKSTEQKVIEEVKEEPKKEEVKEEVKEQPILEEITEEKEEPKVEVKEKPIEEKIVEPKQQEKKYPEKLQKLVDFMNDTGGSVEDYVAINKDYSSVDDKTLLREYYQQEKKHLTSDEIDFLIEDKFSYEEDVDDEKEVKRKKLAFKEEAAKAREHVNSLKNKYYEEIKAGSKLNPEQQKAVEFFNRYNEEKEQTDNAVKQQRSVFDKKTNEFFNDKFKGFEYSVGEKKFRFKVNNVNDVKSNQSDINNFVKKFLNKENVMKDAKGYHKSLFTAMNADAVANHFYEQGKSDAIKESMANSKNVDMNPRGVHSGEIKSDGFKVRAVPSQIDSAQFKVKLNKSNNKIT